MKKSDFIKVSGFGVNKVLLAANSKFYKEHKFKIDTPTDEEIMAEFPEYRKEEPAAPAEEPAEEPADGKRGRKATK